REYFTLALAQAQLTDNQTEQALASYRMLETEAFRSEFLVSYAKRLLANGEQDGALKQLHEANHLLAQEQSPLMRLNTFRQSQLIAEGLVLAGAKEEARGVLDEMAELAQGIPMNPMVLALMLKISTAIADAGFPADAAKRVEHT